VESLIKTPSEKEERGKEEYIILPLADLSGNKDHYGRFISYGHSAERKRMGGGGRSLLLPLLLGGVRGGERKPLYQKVY